MNKSCAILFWAFRCIQLSGAYVSYFNIDLHSKSHQNLACRSSMSPQEFDSVDDSFLKYEMVNDRKKLSELRIGTWYEGVVTHVVSFGIFVDIGAEMSGLVHLSQLSDGFVSDPNDVVSEGQIVRVKLHYIDTFKKRIVFSMRTGRRLSHIQPNVDMDRYAAMLAEDPSKFITGVVDNIVRYGAFIKLDEGCNGFLHISQLRPRSENIQYVNEVLSIGQEVKVRIKEVDQEMNRINLSLLPLQKNKEQEMFSSKKLAMLAKLDRSVFREGSISAIQDYGLFVNIDGLNGLLHISRIDGKDQVTSENIRDKFELGQNVSVRILNVDANAKRFTLSQIPTRPWSELSWFASLPENEWVEGHILSTAAFGAYIRLAPGIKGELSLSEMAENFNVETDAPVRVRILKVIPEEQKILVSMRDPGRSPVAAYSGEWESTKKSKMNEYIDKLKDSIPHIYVPGKVVSFVPYGAFIRLDDGVDGLLHNSKITNEPIRSAEDVLELNQEVNVRVVSVHPDTGRIGLSMLSEKDTVTPSPRPKHFVTSEDFDKDLFVRGTIKKVFSYGCLVQFAWFPKGDMLGLLHISQISESRIASVSDILHIGDAVMVRVVEVVDEGKIFLSMLQPGSPKDKLRRSMKKGSQLKLNGIKEKLEDNAFITQLDDGNGITNEYMNTFDNTLSKNEIK